MVGRSPHGDDDYASGEYRLRIPAYERELDALVVRLRTGTVDHGTPRPRADTLDP